MLRNDPSNVSLSDEWQRRIDELETALEQTRWDAEARGIRIVELERERDELFRSRAWRLTQRLKAAGHWVLPAGSQRRRAIQLAARCVRAVPRLRDPRFVASRSRRAFRRLAGVTQEAEARRAELERLIPVFPRHGSVAASIIIPVYNHVDQTVKCLASIARSETDFAYEVIVVDDGSSDQTAALLRSRPGLVYLRNKKNLGFIGSCNRGAAAAQGSHLVFLNNDTEVAPGWLSALRQTFDRVPGTGLVGAKLVYPDGRLQEAGGVIWRDASGWNYGHSDDPEHPRYNFPRETDYCSGACIMVPADLFHRLGGFDPLYAPAYYEDVDLAFKIQHAGHKVIYQPRARVVHYEGVTSGTSVASGVKSFQVINQPRFRDRWQERLDNHPDPPRERRRIVRAHSPNQHAKCGQVLIVDHRELTPDRDCGSLRMFEIVRALRRRGHHVTFIPNTLEATSPYLENLQDLGVEVVQRPYYASVASYLEQHGADFELVLLSRAFVTELHLEAVRTHSPRARLVFDTVDLQYLREARHVHLGNAPEYLANNAHAARKAQELELVRKVDLTLTVSELERQMLQDECPGAAIQVLSTIYPTDDRPRPGFAERKDILFVGGFAHAPNADAALYFARSIFPLIQAELPEAVFHIVGPEPTPEVLALAGPNIVVHGFVPEVEPLFDQCRLSVAPLRFGAGVKGKVNQSMALGVPVVLTTLAAEGMFLEHERDALIADNPTDFARSVVRLWRSPDLWARLVEHGHHNLSTYFSVEAASQRVDELLAWANMR